MCSTNVLVVEKPRQRSKIMPSYTQKQRKAFIQGKKDGAEHGELIANHLETHKAQTESYHQGVNKGKKSFNSNKKRNRKQVRKYQSIFDGICMRDEGLQGANVKKVDTMLTKLEAVVNSSDLFKKQKDIMDKMVLEAGQDYAKRKKCANYVMALVKNYHIKGSDDETNSAAVAMKALNESVAESNKTIHSIRRNIYQTYIDNEEKLTTILLEIDDTIKQEEIPRIVNAMKIQRAAIDTEDSKADGKKYRKSVQEKSKSYSESEGDMSNRSSVDFNSQPGTPSSQMSRRRGK